MKKLEPYYDSMFHILFFIVVFIIFGIFMYTAIRNIMAFRVSYDFIFHLSRNL